MCHFGTVVKAAVTLILYHAESQNGTGINGLLKVRSLYVRFVQRRIEPWLALATLDSIRALAVKFEAYSCEPNFS